MTNKRIAYIISLQIYQPMGSWSVASRNTPLRPPRKHPPFTTRSPPGNLCSARLSRLWLMGAACTALLLESGFNSRWRNPQCQWFIWTSSKGHLGVPMHSGYHGNLGASQTQIFWRAQTNTIRTLDWKLCTSCCSPESLACLIHVQHSFSNHILIKYLAIAILILIQNKFQVLDSD